MWMGIFWMGLGVFFLLSSLVGKGAYLVPALQINLGWIILPLGALRVWWWWKSEEEPRRQRAAFLAEVRKLEAEEAAAAEPSGKPEVPSP